MKRRLLTTLMSVAVAGSVIAGSSLTSFAYTVQPGDTLGKIASENNVTVEQIVAENGIANPNLIQVGQEISIPGSSGVETANIPAPLKAALNQSFDAKYYAEQNPDVVEAMGDSEDVLFLHFVTHGIWEGRQMNKDFNVSAYASAYEDLREAFANKSNAEQLLSYYRHYIAFVESGMENRLITTVEAAVSAGLTVTNVSTNTEVNGTILAKPAPAPAPTVSKRYIEDYIINTYSQSRDSIVAWVTTYGADNEFAQAWLAAEANATTPSEKIAWLDAFNYGENSVVANMTPSAESAAAFENIKFFYDTLYSGINNSLEFAEFQDYVRAVTAWEDANPIPEGAIDFAAYEAAHTEWETTDTSAFTEEMLIAFMQAEPNIRAYYTETYYEYEERLQYEVKYADYFKEWAIAVFFSVVS